MITAGYILLGLAGFVHFAFAGIMLGHAMHGDIDDYQWEGKMILRYALIQFSLIGAATGLMLHAT